jgi:hypothetical protein
VGGPARLEVPNLELAELAGALESLHALPDEHAQRCLLALAERAVRLPQPKGPLAAASRRRQQPRRRGLL